MAAVEQAQQPGLDAADYCDLESLGLGTAFIGV